ncbi:hypothetical protein ABH973_004396 [Bradyrhizobium ottawaense]
MQQKDQTRGKLRIAAQTSPGAIVRWPRFPAVRVALN